MQAHPPEGIYNRRGSWLVWAAWAVAVVLVFLALRATPLDKAWSTLRAVGAGQILILIAINALILTLMALRWWLILRSLKCSGIGLGVLLSYRLVGFGVSFFTPGPQFGGEPVQVDLLHRRKSVPLSAALSSVYLDRLLDLLANFTFLAVGVAVAFLNGFTASGQAGWVWAVVGGIMFLPGAHLAALTLGKSPVTWLTARILAARGGTFWERTYELTRQAEDRITSLCREQPLNLLLLSMLSGLIWILMIFEYGITLSFLGVTPTPGQVVIAMTAGRLALLTPVPGGLGALEASQVLATQALGWGAQVGLALSIVIRARDLLLAGFGVGLGALIYQKFNAKKQW
jgi:glycosyltransferase 2 family protein